jgi:hypothetical protein
MSTQASSASSIFDDAYKGYDEFLISYTQVSDDNRITHRSVQRSYRSVMPFVEALHNDVSVVNVWVSPMKKALYMDDLLESSDELL